MRVLINRGQPLGRGIFVPKGAVAMCENCALWRPVGSSGPGQCRRSGPVAGPFQAELMHHPPVWPATEPTDWCGDFSVLLVAETGGERAGALAPSRSARAESVSPASGGEVWDGTNERVGA